MWNSYSTGGPLAITAGITTYVGGGGDEIHAYVARPVGDETRPTMVFTHHMPGFDELNFEWAERFARNGYDVIMPDLYCRFGHGNPDDVYAKVRSEGGAYDEQVVEDAAAAVAWAKALPTHNGKVGVMGSCSGGRHALLAASLVDGFDAVVDLWGGSVIMRPEDLSPQRPVAPIEYTERLSAPLLGIFGNDDVHPTPDLVDLHEARLQEAGKDYEFHRYDGAGHGFFYYQLQMYRQEQAVDAWSKVFDFLNRNLKG